MPLKPPRNNRVRRTITAKMRAVPYINRTYNYPEENIRITYEDTLTDIPHPNRQDVFIPGYNILNAISLTSNRDRRRFEIERIRDFAERYGTVTEKEKKAVRIFYTLLPGYPIPLMTTVTAIS